MTGTVTTDRPSVAKSVSRPRFQKVRERQRVGISAAPRLQPDLHRQARKPKA